MATFLDLSLFEHVSAVFIFIFVFLIVYAFLSMTKIFKEVSGQSGIYALIALTIAFMASFSDGFVAVITTMTPWFTILIVFLFLVFFVVRMFTTDDSLFDSMLRDGSVKWVLIILFVIILLVSLSSAFGQGTLEKGTGATQVETSTQTSGETVYETSSTTSTSVATTSSESGVATDDFGTNVTLTFFHPKILGMLLLVLISFFTILLMARTQEPSK